MEARLNPRKVAPDAMKAMSAFHDYVRSCGLDHRLLELVKLRASQINGCAWCMDMHTKELRAAGEDEQRLHLLSAWRECPFYSERERAALVWTEALTRLKDGNVPEEVFAGTQAAGRIGAGARSSIRPSAAKSPKASSPAARPAPRWHGSTI
jgi:AhpD family alkylhydroperoxidase